MPTFRYKILLTTNSHHETSTEEWYPVLSNIYGVPTRNFDGYISNISINPSGLEIHSYLEEGPEEHDKLISLKTRNKDWAGFRALCVIDAIKIHARALGYSITETSIELLTPNKRFTPTKC